MRKNKNKRKNNKIIYIIFALIILAIIILLIIYQSNNKDKLKVEIKDFSKYYNEVVITNEDAKIYEYSNDNYNEIGIIHKETKILLEEPSDKTSEYFKIKDLNNEYYIKYSSINKTEEYYKENSRYKKYIVFNKNIITTDTTTFYKDDNKVYTINKSFNLPLIINDNDEKYYVEYNNMLLYVTKENVKEIIDNNNTQLKNTNGIPVLNYHFVYKPEEEECNQEICHPESQFRTHLSFIKDNGYFTPTMEELEMYIDGKIQLPNSVVITIDDGRNVNLATEILDEYKLNATAFIVTGRYNIETDFIKSEYVELQSHSHNLHNAGTCPPGHGQGGGLTCLSDEEILKDLKTSREALKGSIAFCYPFYEHNSHSIELLKQAGFTMAFAGEYTGGKTKATVGINKFRIPRWVIVNWTSKHDFESYVTGTV